MSFPVKSRILRFCCPWRSHLMSSHCRFELWLILSSIKEMFFDENSFGGKITLSQDNSLAEYWKIFRLKFVNKRFSGKVLFSVLLKQESFSKMTFSSSTFPRKRSSGIFSKLFPLKSITLRSEGNSNNLFSCWFYKKS